MRSKWLRLFFSILALWLQCTCYFIAFSHSVVLASNDQIPATVYQNLCEKEKAFFSGGLQCLVEEKWTTGRNVKRVESAFFFSDRKGLKGAIKDSLGFDSLIRSFNDEQLAQVSTERFGREPFIIANRTYGSLIRSGASGGYSMMSRAEIFGVSQVGDTRIGTCEPFSVPHLSLFKSMFGLELRELVESSYVHRLTIDTEKSLLKISALVQLNKEYSPWLEELNGNWNASINTEEGLIVFQSYKCALYDVTVSVEGEFPTSLTLVKSVISNENKDQRLWKYRTIRYQPSHSRIYDECFLTHYGLPEPLGVVKPGFQLWYLAPFIALIASGLGWWLLRRR